MVIFMQVLLSSGEHRMFSFNFFMFCVFKSSQYVVYELRR